MKTNAKDRKWMKAAAEEHGCMEPRQFCDSFDCTTVSDLIIDVDEAVRLLKNICQDNRRAAAILRDAERHIASGGKGQDTSTLQEKVIRARKLLERTVPYDTFLKEPNKGVDSDKK